MGIANKKEEQESKLDKVLDYLARELVYAPHSSDLEFFLYTQNSNCWKHLKEDEFDELLSHLPEDVELTENEREELFIRLKSLEFGIHDADECVSDQARENETFSELAERYGTEDISEIATRLKEEEESIGGIILLGDLIDYVKRIKEEEQE